jgi:hypothetical protein
MMFALIYYAVSGRKWFKGPRINVEHIIHGTAVDGESPSSGSAEHVPEKALGSPF